MQYELAALLPPSGEGRANGEPDWLPDPQEVARARVRLERRGVVRALGRTPVLAAGPVTVRRGETPWLWWGTAALWMVVWPALFALKISSDRPAWLPLWLPFLLAPLHMACLALPVLLSERSAGRGSVRRRFGQVRTLAEIMALEPVEFEAWSALLFQLMGYRVQNTQDSGDHGIDLQLSNERVRRGIVQCKRYRGTVGEPVARDLYGTMVHVGAERGWLLTTGGISRQARAWCNGKPIELWDGQSLVALARQYR